MAYIDDFIRDNAGTMTRDQLTTSLRGAGYSDGEIKRALRHAPRYAGGRDPMTWGAVTSGASGPRATGTIATLEEYIRANRGRHSREALIAEMVRAGHDRATIETAWSRINGASAAAQRPSWTKWIGFVVVAFVVAAFILPEGISPGLVWVVWIVIIGAGWVWRLVTRRNSG